MEMTPKQADALGRFVLTLRPDWQLVPTLDAVARMRLIETDVERVARAAVRCALSPRVSAPTVLAMNGAHWKATADAEPERPVDVAQRCPDCHGFHSVASPCDVERSPDWRDRIAELRLAHGDARRHLCSHGIRRAYCARHDERESA